MNSNSGEAGHWHVKTKDKPCWQREVDTENWWRINNNSNNNKCDFELQKRKTWSHTWDLTASTKTSSAIVRHLVVTIQSILWRPATKWWKAIFLAWFGFQRDCNDASLCFWYFCLSAVKGDKCLPLARKKFKIKASEYQQLQSLEFDPCCKLCPLARIWLVHKLLLCLSCCLVHMCNALIVNI